MQQTGFGSQAALPASGTAMTWSELEAAFAPERLAPYLKHASGDRDLAVALYLWNVALCESLYPLLNLSEITLRNRFHQVLCQHFQRQTGTTTPGWISAMLPRCLRPSRRSHVTGMA